MNIIYLHQYFKFPNERGGTRSYDLAKSFVSKGHTVNVITSTSDAVYKTNQRWTVVERDGIEIHYIYMPYSNEMSYLQRMWVFFKFLWLSTFRILSVKADVVLATSTPLTIGIPALVKKWFGRTPYIFEVRDVWPEAVIAIGAIKSKWMQKMLYWLEEVIYKNASAIVPLSVDMQKSIVSRYPQFSKKADVVIENISEVNRFQNDVVPIDLKQKIGIEPRFAMLYAGTLGRVNGIDYVVQLAKKTIDIDAGLVYILIGGGVMKEDVRQQARDAGVLDKNIFILDSIPKNELSGWYKAISMGSSFVADIEELWANSANKFFDTLAAAKPVLINHEGWQADTIRESNIGYVLPTQITDASAKQFVEYTQDISLQEEQCINALDIAREKFSLEVAVGKYDKIIREIP